MANTNESGNKMYKNDVFWLLLQEKERALEIYNAINGTAYDNPELVEINTLKDSGFTLSIRNDASFILDANLSLYEHQSTYCPNMPLRDLIYFTTIIQKYTYELKRDMYGRTLIKIPVPHFVVFYNGTENAPERYELRLSDAFEKPTDSPEIELVCQVYNINKGNNQELLERCPTLRDYMYFVDLVREYHAKNDYIDLEVAIEQAIEQCIRENVLKEFLIRHGKEVMDVMTLDYTFERRLELQHEEGVEEGWRLGEEHGRKLGEEQGRKLGEKDGMQKKLHDLISKKLRKNKSLEQIADELEETPDAIRPLYEQVKEELAEK